LNIEERERVCAMERREDKRGGLMVEKLREGVLVGKKGGPSTPPPTWRLELPSQYNGSDNVQEFLNFPTSSSLSARKLCANLWELLPHQQQHTPPVKMNKLGTNLSRRRRNRRRLRHPKDTASEVNNTQLAEPPDTPSGSDQVLSQFM